MGKDSELFKAAKSGNTAVLERVFATYLKKHSQGHHGIGSGLGSIRNKAHPNIQDETGCTLLHHSTLHGQRETVLLLLKCGASTTIADSSGSCPLHLAAWRGDSEIVKLLVTQGPSRANVNQQSDSDDTALHLASQFGYSNVVEFLLQRHADPLLTNVRGETPLDLAAQYGHLDAVHLLISHCPEILQLARHEFSPLHLAARNGHSVVALSLINAGIPVNTVCEGGSALHEAAMCGKTETVQLLLDKGVDLSLKDSKDRTVLDLLEEYTAEKAKEIKTLIQAHLERARRSGSVPLKEKRILAIAQITCTPVIEGSSALAFTKGDTIAVMKKSSTGVYFGTVNGQTGSFLAQDVVFFKEKGGHMIATDVSRLSEDSEEEDEDTTRQPLPNVMVSTKPPYEHIPSFPNRDSTVTVNSEVTSPISAHHQDVFEMSLHSDGGQRSEMTSSLAPPTEGGGHSIVKKRMSKKEKRFQLSSDDGTYSELTEINPHQARKEFGDTLRLNPVGPAFTASTDQSNASLVESQVVTSHNVTGATEQDPPQQLFMGSYYVLEVGNFEQDSENRVEVSPPLASIEPPGGVSAVPPPREGGSLQPQAGEFQGSYFILDFKNFEGDDPNVAGQGTSRKSLSPLDTREGKTPPGRSKSASPVEENSEDLFYDTPRNVSDHLAANPHVLQKFTESITSSQSSSATPLPHGQGEYVNVKTRGAPSYENVPLPQRDGQTDANKTPEIGDNNSTSVSSIAPLYHTVSLEQEERGNRKPPQIATSDPTTRAAPAKPKRSPRKPLSTGSYKDVPLSSLYENVSVLKTEKKDNKDGASDSVGKRGSNLRPRSREPSPLLTAIAPDVVVTTDDASSNQIGANSVESGLKRKSVKRDQIYEAVSVGVKSEPKRKTGTVELNCSDSDLSSQRNSMGEGLNRELDVAGKSLSQALLESTGIIENSENPFAGLVISASRQLDEGVSTLTPSHQQHEEAVSFRNRSETVWDNDRVEQEWIQIDSMLRGIDIEVPTPASGSHDQSPSNSQSGGGISKWLAGVGIERYTEVLLTNGFDDLQFLGGTILAMDDLEDIGIHSQTDQYDIMAAVSLLEAPPTVKHAPSVSEWLRLLHLSQLEANFERYSLQKLSTLWDIELSSVIGVELLGYRKRLQYGIAELRSGHPEWSSASLTPSHPHHSPSTTPFVKDYRKIRSKPSPRGSPRNSQSDSPGRRPSFPKQDTDIAMRPPLQAQASALSGRADRECKMPSDSWHHPNTALIKEAISYSVKYLGSVIVRRLHGNQSAEEACLKLRMSTENMMKVPEIILSISWKGVKFVDGHTKIVVSTHAIRDISYCTPDIEDPTVFAYITKDKERNYCHVFMAASKEIAGEIRMTIGQAFEICYQKVMKARRYSSNSRESVDSN